MLPQNRVKFFAEGVLFLLGLVLFGTVIYAVGPSRLAVIGPALGGAGWMVFLIYPWMCAWDTCAWRRC